MNNINLILNKYSELKGQLIISDFQVSRLIGIVEDEEDYYYCLYDGRKLWLTSCVGGIIPLKGYINNSDYNEMIRLCKLNHYDQPTLFNTKEDMSGFIEIHKKTLLMGWDENTRFTAGPDWDLN